jgi:hypothetical protein
MVIPNTAHGSMTPLWLRKAPSATITSQGAGGKKFSTNAARAMME